MSYPRLEAAKNAVIGKKEYDAKVIEIKEFIKNEHRDQWGNLTNEFFTAMEELGFDLIEDLEKEAK